MKSCTVQRRIEEQKAQGEKKTLSSEAESIGLRKSRVGGYEGCTLYLRLTIPPGETLLAFEARLGPLATVRGVDYDNYWRLWLSRLSESAD